MSAIEDMRAWRELGEKHKAKLISERASLVSQLADIDELLAELGAVPAKRGGGRPRAVLAVASVEDGAGAVAEAAPAELDEPAAEPISPPNVGGPPPEADQIATVLYGLRDLFHTLPSAYRKTVELRASGKSVGEVATILRVDRQYVAGIIFRMRGQLQAARQTGAKPQAQAPAADGEEDPEPARPSGGVQVNGNGFRWFIQRDRKRWLGPTVDTRGEAERGRIEAVVALAQGKEPDTAPRYRSRAQREAARAAAAPKEEQPDPDPDPDVLVTEHREWAEKLARKTANGLPNIDVDEAVGEAMVALVQTAKVYRPGEGATFKTFAAHRVRGSVLDVHRRADPVGRHQRMVEKQGIETVAARRGLPQRLNLDVADLERDRKLGASSPAGQFASAELVEALAAFRALPARIGNVMERHFINGENLKVIGASLGVTESRVCQIVKEGRARLKAAREARTSSQTDPAEEDSGAVITDVVWRRVFKIIGESEVSAPVISTSTFPQTSPSVVVEKEEVWTPPADDGELDRLNVTGLGRARAKMKVVNGRTRAKTIAPGRMTRDERRLTELLVTPDVLRPLTRGDCEADPGRPCPWVSCPHHNYLDVNPETGAIKLNFPHLEVWEMKDSCSLDVADRGGITLEETGAILNLTRERIRQVEVMGLDKIKNSDVELDRAPERHSSALGAIMG